MLMTWTTDKKMEIQIFSQDNKLFQKKTSLEDNHKITNINRKKPFSPLKIM